MNKTPDAIYLVGILWLSALRAAAWRIESPNRPQPHELVQHRLLPELATSGIHELKLMPGFGHHRAQQLIKQRAKLGFPVTTDNIHLLTGFSRQTGQELSAWYRSQGKIPRR